MGLKNDLIDFFFAYGWALLVVLACIGILVYFGVFDQSPRHEDINQQICEQFCPMTNGKCYTYDFVSREVKCIYQQNLFLANKSVNVSFIRGYSVEIND